MVCVGSAQTVIAERPPLCMGHRGVIHGWSVVMHACMLAQLAGQASNTHTSSVCD